MFTIRQSIIEESLHFEFAARDFQFNISTLPVDDGFEIRFKYMWNTQFIINRIYIVSADLVHQLLEVMALVISGGIKELSYNDARYLRNLPPKYGTLHRTIINDEDFITEIQDIFRNVWDIPQHSEYYDYLKANFDWVYKTKITKE